MVSVPCASGVQLEDKEMTGGSVARAFDNLLVTALVEMEAGAFVGVLAAGLVGVGIFAGGGVLVVMPDRVSFGALATVFEAVPACVALAALARVLAKTSAMSARKPETIKIDLCL